MVLLERCSGSPSGLSTLTTKRRACAPSSSPSGTSLRRQGEQEREQKLAERDLAPGAPAAPGEQQREQEPAERALRQARRDGPPWRACDARLRRAEAGRAGDASEPLAGGDPS